MDRTKQTEFETGNNLIRLKVEPTWMAQLESMSTYMDHVWCAWVNIQKNFLDFFDKKKLQNEKDLRARLFKCWIVSFQWCYCKDNYFFSCPVFWAY